eukprot:3578676-Rhodomonas_salina.1
MTPGYRVQCTVFRRPSESDSQTPQSQHFNTYPGSYELVILRCSFRRPLFPSRAGVCIPGH